MGLVVQINDVPNCVMKNLLITFCIDDHNWSRTFEGSSSTRYTEVSLCTMVTCSRIISSDTRIGSPILSLLVNVTRPIVRYVWVARKFFFLIKRRLIFQQFFFYIFLYLFYIYIFLYLYGLYTRFYKKFKKTPVLGMNLPLY